MKKKNAITAIAGAAVALLAAVFFLRRNHREEKPPKGAPQLEIDNPGEQSEFSPAPSGERDLG
ncbi:MAG: hypothetical protein ACO1OO_13560 [Flavisolibacter sp.]